jgi:hypothetical protein
MKRKNIQVVMANPFWRFHKLLSRVEFLMIWYNWYLINRIKLVCELGTSMALTKNSNV